MVLEEVRDFEALPGLGASGTVQGKPVLVGNLKLLEERGISTRKRGGDRQKTVFFREDLCLCCRGE